MGFLRNSLYNKAFLKSPLKKWEITLNEKEKIMEIELLRLREVFRQPYLVGKATKNTTTPQAILPLLYTLGVVSLSVPFVGF